MNVPGSRSFSPHSPQIDLNAAASNYYPEGRFITKDLLSSPAGLDFLVGRSNRLGSDALLLEHLQDAVRVCQETDLLIFSVLAHRSGLPSGASTTPPV